MQYNELKPGLIGITSLNSFAKHNSSARSVMFSGHLSQHLVINGLEEKIVQSGVEQEFAKYTFSVKMPENGRIIKIIERYPQGIDRDSLPFNPETLIIYEIEETKEIDCFTIPNYASYDQIFGFEYKHTEALEKLKPNAYIAKDTKFSDTPGVSENGSYMYGVNLNTAFMSIPSVAEDGVLICEDIIDKLSFKIYEKRTVSFGSTMFPLNIYGTINDYRPFPEIGSRLKEDGVLMMLRNYEQEFSPIGMSIYDVQEPNFMFDRAVYVKGGGGKIVDVEVIRNHDTRSQLPEEMSGYLNKYHKALLRYYQEIIDTEKTLRYESRRKYGDNSLRLTPRFHNLIVKALAITNQPIARDNKVLTLQYRKAPLDEYMVNFVVEYEVKPNLGFKLTCEAGGKGVIVQVEKPENMPVDADGNRADIILDPASTISRMNIGRLYTHYISGATRDVRKKLRSILGITEPRCSVDKLYGIDPKLVDEAYNFLMAFYKCISIKQYEFFSSLQLEDKLEHLSVCLEDKINSIQLFIPIDNQIPSVDMINAIEALVKPTYGPVSYVGNSGRRCTTKANIRIAPLYMMLLDKIADEWSSVSTGRLQHFGILSPTIKSEKFLFPYRNTPIRAYGETECRILLIIGRRYLAELMDRNNNPRTQRIIYATILTSDEPMKIGVAVDRTLHPFGESKNLQVIKHATSTAGFKYKYQKEVIDGITR